MKLERQFGLITSLPRDRDVFVNLCHATTDRKRVTGVTVTFNKPDDDTGPEENIVVRMNFSDARSLAHRILRAIGDRV